MRSGYERLAGLDEALDRVQQLAVQTVVVDIEPLVAYWDSGQEALDKGFARVVALAVAVPGIKVVCFSTNSLRRPSLIPTVDAQVRVVYLVAAGKLTWSDIRELGEVVTGKAKGRTSPSDVTLFKSLGIALEDMAFGELVYQRALAQKVGRPM